MQGCRAHSDVFHGVPVMLRFLFGWLLPSSEKPEKITTEWFFIRDTNHSIPVEFALDWETSWYPYGPSHEQKVSLDDSLFRKNVLKVLRKKAYIDGRDTIPCITEKGLRRAEYYIREKFQDVLDHSRLPVDNGFGRYGTNGYEHCQQYFEQRTDEKAKNHAYKVNELLEAIQVAQLMHGDMREFIQQALSLGYVSPEGLQERDILLDQDLQVMVTE